MLCTLFDYALGVKELFLQSFLLLSKNQSNFNTAVMFTRTLLTTKNRKDLITFICWDEMLLAFFPLINSCLLHSVSLKITTPPTCNCSTILRVFLIFCCILFISVLKLCVFLFYFCFPLHPNTAVICGKRVHFDKLEIFYHSNA